MGMGEDLRRLPPWLATPRGIRIDGELWSTDGWGAWAVEPPEGAGMVNQTEAIERMLHAEAEMEPLPITKREHVNGFVLINDTTIVSAHRLGLAEKLFPGLTWKKTSDGQIVGFQEGRPRSVIMRANEKSIAEVKASERGGYPRCWVCEGTGGDYCDHCHRGEHCEECEGTGVRKDWEVPA